MTVGEANGVKIEDAELWVGEEQGKFNMVFQFEHLSLWDAEKKKDLDVVGLKKVLTKWQKGLENKGWNALYIENHDKPRIVSTWGDDKQYWRESATALGAMYFFMHGTPFIYQGQEIGMTNVQLPNIEDYDDVAIKNLYREKIAEGVPHQDMMEIIWASCRDNSRTPMQWNDEMNAGFTTSTPWFSMNPNYKEINVEKQKNEEKSIFNFYKKMIALKKEHDVLNYGTYDLLLEDDPQIYAYTRTLQDEKVIVISNISKEEAVYNEGSFALERKRLLLNNYEVAEHEEVTTIALKPYETRLYRIS
ncbi:glucan 1%2C6-alpha-glucosidase [Streptococcus pneumoniae]|nr:glucan 1%2C6-alpha-glucosidase [Streptococcus pneumoniae]